MIKLEMRASQGEISVGFEVSDTKEDQLRLDELATFALHLDVVKHRITELTHKAIAEADGHKLITSEAENEDRP